MNKEPFLHAKKSLLEICRNLQCLKEILSLQFYYDCNENGGIKNGVWFVASFFNINNILL